ncbi:hypothetical protein GOB25_16895 [Sinorhizobium meliloti]|nr:hypothetical protein [Sinorhizobium meliloti]
MQKIAHYRRVVWLSEKTKVLEDVVKEGLAMCPDVATTKFEYRSDIDVQISNRCTNGQGVGLYFTLFSEGRRAATVENGGATIRKRNAPAGEEFLKTGIMLVIEGNNVGYVADGHTNDGQITALFHRFFKERQFNDDVTQFALAPKPNHDQIKKLLKNGVKSIDLGVTSFAASVEQLSSAGSEAAWLAPLRVVGDAFKNALGKDRTAEEREAASEIEASIHLGYDGRSANHLIPIILGQLAEGVEKNSTDFKIVTKDDAVITHDKLIIKTKFQSMGMTLLPIPTVHSRLSEVP